MLKVFLTVFLIGSASHALSTLPDGHYEGQASWKDTSGGKGTYTVSTLVQNDVLMTTYKFGTTSAIYAFRMEETTNGFFNVFHKGAQVGSGYCMSVQCHYTAEFGTTRIEETLTFYQGHLYRVGSKTAGGVLIGWQEAQQKVK